MKIKEIIKPAEEQFYPRITLKQTVPEAMGHSLYFASGVHLHALNAGNGARQWSLHISNQRSYEDHALAPGSFISMPAPLDGLSGVAVQHNCVFVVTVTGVVYAFGADKGLLIWRHETSSFGSMPTIFDDTLYVPSGTIYALSSQDGCELWSYPTQDVVISQPVIVDGTLYAGSYGNAVYALDAATGQPRWIYQADGRVYVAPIVHDGVVYAGIGDAGCRLSAIDVQSGQLIWRNTPILEANAQLLVVDGLLYTSQRNSLVGINLETGRPAWHYQDMQNVSLLAHQHVLYVASASGDLYAFETPGHNLLWHQKLRTLRVGEATRIKLLGNELYVGFNEHGQGHLGTLHAIDTYTGNENWVAELDEYIKAPDIV